MDRGPRAEHPAGRPAAQQSPTPWLPVCCPPAWHLLILPVGPHSSFHPWFLLFEGRASLPLPCL